MVIASKIANRIVNTVYDNKTVVYNKLEITYSILNNYL